MLTIEEACHKLEFNKFTGMLSINYTGKGFQYEVAVVYMRLI